ncbi:MAG: hypothetical protein PHN84_00460 [Desulfuromonadaceae bacterium]|nr:hypothetical protein [Desulfuromonadaceae bacterium]MDD2854267.1 hypothetical protein [Desulfuromonadaceae bacterium]
MDYLIIQYEKKCLNVARFNLSRNSAELIGSEWIEINEESGLYDALQHIAGKLSGSPRVLLCLPPSLFAQRIVNLPFNDVRKAREVLPSQLQGEITLGVEDLSLQAMSLGDGKFLALWARKSELAKIIEQFCDAGVEPQVVTSSVFALAELPGLSTDYAFCDSNLLAIISSGRLTYFRASETDFTPQTITSTLSTLELSGIKLPSQLYYTGTIESESPDAASLPLPLKALEVPGNLGNLFKNDSTFQQLALLYAVARANYAGILPDFRHGELAWRAGDLKLRKKLVLTGILFVTIVILIFVNKGIQYRSAVADLNSLNKSISLLYHEIFPTRTKAVDEISEIKGEIRKLSGVDISVSYVEILKKLAEFKGNSIDSIYEAELDGRHLRIKGYAHSAQAANEFKKSLEQILDSSELGEVKSRPDGIVTFSLTGVVKEVAE